MSVIDELDKIYKDIKECHICPEMDPEKTLLLTQSVNPKSDVFIISQSLAEDMARLSGVRFFKPNGELGVSGRNLEKFLNKFNRTVYPPQEVRLSKDATIRKCEPSYLPVYTTPIVQCYPGRKENGEYRTPKKPEILNCIHQGFVIRELELIKPKLLILMGKPSRDNFYEHILKTSFPDSLSEHISEIVQSKEIPNFTITNKNMHVLPIQSSSGSNNKRFYDMLNNDKLIELIKQVLK